MSRLPPEERLERLGAVLHERCVKAAAHFVKEEHRRGDSPFRGVENTDLFHEILALNFWMFESLFKGGRPELMERLYRHHSRDFLRGRGPSTEQLVRELREKFRIYDRSWDDHTGHQDVFARQALGLIFGGGPIAQERQAAFWLIVHADQTMREFAEVTESVDELLGQ